MLELFQLLYVEDGAFLFESQDDMIKGVNLINTQFKKFGTEMHIGRDGKASKKKMHLLPAAGRFQTTRNWK